MRTTIRVNDHLLSEAKKFAAETGRSLTALIEDALREVLARRKKRPSMGRLKLTTFKGKGLQPGVDLDDSASLLDLMERGHDSD
jgi:hypothetical protein